MPLAAFQTGQRQQQQGVARQSGDVFDDGLRPILSKFAARDPQIKQASIGEQRQRIGLGRVTTSF